MRYVLFIGYFALSFVLGFFALGLAAQVVTPPPQPGVIKNEITAIAGPVTCTGKISQTGRGVVFSCSAGGGSLTGIAEPPVGLVSGALFSYSVAENTITVLVTRETETGPTKWQASANSTKQTGQF